MESSAIKKTTVTDITNPDGSITRTVVEEISIPNQVSPSPAAALSIPSSTVQPPETFLNQAAPVVTSKDPESFNSLSIAAICLAVSLWIFGITATALTAVANEDYDNYYYSPTQAGALAMGAIAILCFLIATPLQCCATQSYFRKRVGGVVKPNTCLNITAWVLYGLCTINGLALIDIGVANEWYYVSPLWVIVTVIWGFVPWLLMFLDSERVRKSDVIQSGAALTQSVLSRSVVTESTIAPTAAQGTDHAIPDNDV